MAAASAMYLGARLLVLCSGEAVVEDFPFELVMAYEIPTAVVPLGNLPEVLPNFSTSTHVLANNPWSISRDVSEKRNLGLLLAKSAGWTSVLFLDDDVRFPEMLGIGQDGRVFGWQSLHDAHDFVQRGGDAAAWVMIDFHDNSVVCHARRLAKLEQASFVGGGSLLVRIGSTTPFFPKIYNEDWLFLYTLLERRGWRTRSVGGAGIVHQAKYEPFVVKRALSEEVGDLFAEGLFSSRNKIGSGVNKLPIHDPAYWMAVEERRRGMLREVIDGLRARATEGLLAEAEFKKVSAVLEEVDAQHSMLRSAGINYESYPDYLMMWYIDRLVWYSRLRSVTRSVARSILSSRSIRFVSCSGIDGFLRGESSVRSAERRQSAARSSAAGGDHVASDIPTEIWSSQEVGTRDLVASHL